jgi:hypothetical protein
MCARIILARIMQEKKTPNSVDRIWRWLGWSGERPHFGRDHHFQ